jgi:hypothetical protein
LATWVHVLIASAAAIHWSVTVVSARRQKRCQSLLLIRAGPGARLTERVEELLPVGVMVEIRRPPIAPVHHMVDRSGVLNPQWPGMARL